MEGVASEVSLKIRVSTHDALLSVAGEGMRRSWPSDVGVRWPGERKVVTGGVIC